VSPILLRPIREQFEHDRVIRQLQTRLGRKFDVAMNPGASEEVSVRIGNRTLFPDIVLSGGGGSRRLHGLVEVETAESVNHLEAKAEWAHFAKARGAFYLYVPAGFTDVAERLCRAGEINVTEIWAYYAIAAQVKFSLTYRSPHAKRAAAAAVERLASGGEKKAAGSSSASGRAASSARRKASKNKETAKPAGSSARVSGAAKKKAGVAGAPKAASATKKARLATSRKKTQTKKTQTRSKRTAASPAKKRPTKKVAKSSGSATARGAKSSRVLSSRVTSKTAAASKRKTAKKKATGARAPAKRK